MPFIPHGVCLANDRWLILLHATSDVTIGVAYMVISGILFYSRRRLLDVLGRLVFAVFAAFIFLCGLTHFYDARIIWHPEYEMQALVKVSTAFASLAAAALIVRLKLALRKGDHAP